MKKNLLMLGVTIGLLTGCSETTKETKQEVSKSVKEARKEVIPESVVKIENLDGVVEHFAKSGFTVGKREKMLFTMIGAADGDGVIINDQKVELYEYKTAEEAEANRQPMVNQADGSAEVVVNGKFMMVAYNDHAAKEKLIQTFKSFK